MPDYSRIHVVIPNSSKNSPKDLNFRELSNVRSKKDPTNRQGIDGFPSIIDKP